MSTESAAYGFVGPDWRGWRDQSTRMKGDRFVCGDCGELWPRSLLGPPWPHDRCFHCEGLLTAVWDVYPGLPRVS